MDQSPLIIHVERPWLDCFPTLWAWSLACSYHTCKLSLVIYHKTYRVSSFDFQNNNKHFSSGDFDLLLVEVWFLFAQVIFLNLNWSSVFLTKCRHWKFSLIMVAKIHFVLYSWLGYYLNEFKLKSNSDHFFFFQACYTRDALAKALYSRLFDFLVQVLVMHFLCSTFNFLKVVVYI